MTQTCGTAEKEFIIWAHRNTCLVCSYPLALYKHLHHIISKDDLGPNHYLNLVALCPNHHYLVERIKRHIIPNQGSSSKQWLDAGSAALQLYKELEKDTQHTLDILSKPHRLSNVIKGGVPDDLLQKAAEELMTEDVRLLDDINKKRPRIFLPLRYVRVPNDLADEQAEKIVAQIGSDFYSEVISAHMERLKLPYRAITNNPKPKNVFQRIAKSRSH